jgi:hypothetical protein
MAERLYRNNPGVDFVNITGSAWSIAGITIDNPSGSWLRITGIEQFIPPFTVGWSYPISPQQTSISVLFVDSPTGTPSSTFGSPVTIRLFDEPVSPSPGTLSGAGEIQTGEIGNKLLAPIGVRLTESLNLSAALLPPAAGTRIALLRAKATASLASSDFECIRTPVQIIINDGAFGRFFPDIVLSPDAPDSGYMSPTGQQLAIDQIVNIGGDVYPGGGCVSVSVYIEYYEVTV